MRQSQKLMRKQRGRTFRPMVQTLECRRLLSGGLLDPHFGQGGISSAEVWPGYQTTMAALDSDGKIVAVGADYFSTNFVISRFNPDGSLDRTFGKNGREKFYLYDSSRNGYSASAVVVQPDHQIVVLAYDSLGNHLFRFLPNGALDRSFAGHGGLRFSFPDRGQGGSMVLEKNGDLVVGDQGAEFTLAAFTSLGRPDRSFGTGGVVSTPAGGASVSGITVAPNGDLLVDGGFQTEWLARYHANGTLDTNFADHGIASWQGNLIGTAGDIAVARDGKILVGSYDGVYRFASNGVMDRSFGVQGLAAISPPPEDPSGANYDGFDEVMPVPQNDGSIIAAGNYVQTGNDYSWAPEPSYFSMAHLTASGQLDTRFGVAGADPAGIDQTFPSTKAYAATTLVQPDGKLILVGTNNTDGSDTGNFSDQDVALARYLPNGKLDDTFGFDGVVLQPNGISGGLTAVAVQKDGKVVVAGNELAPDPSQPQGAALARYNADGSMDLSFGDNGRVFLKIGGGSSGFNAMLLDSNGDIVAGGFGTRGNTKLFAVARFLPCGALDPTFGAGGEALTSFGDPSGQQCNALAMQPDGSIVAAGSTTGGAFGDSEAIAARYLPNGNLDPTFCVGGKFSFSNPLHRGIAANAVALQKDGRILLAGSTIASLPQTQFAVMRLTAGGALDTSFGARGIVLNNFGVAVNDFSSQSGASAYAVGVDSKGRIVVGGTADGSFALARYLSSGVLDTSFGISGIIKHQIQRDGDDEIRTLRIQSNDRILIGGRSQNGEIDEFSARVHPDLGGPPPSDFATVALFNDKGLDQSFGVNGRFVTDINNAVNALAVQSNGQIIAAGNSDVFRLSGV